MQKIALSVNNVSLYKRIFPNASSFLLPLYSDYDLPCLGSIVLVTCPH